VRQCQFPVSGSRCLRHLHGRQFADNAVTQQPVFGHGKAVTFGERQYEMISVEGLQNENICQ
jgi:hypothetical protein